jgi:oxygen-independent coproporphyrinogen-3 oxidase
MESPAIMQDFSYFCVMAGLYIHIPFCKSKCGYCGFYSLPSLKLKDRFLETLKQEIVTRKEYLHGKAIDTIYFGGGTPSLLSVTEIESLLLLINKHYPIASNAEITLEANPDTLSLEYLKSLHQIGINRLSIGIQSFFDNDLQYLGRKHDSHHAQQCLDWVKLAGFSNISIDLIYGLPTSNAEQWNKNLDIFFAYHIPHLSAYALTLEPNSILTKQIELGKALPVIDDDALRDYDILCQRAKENGFLHYEISNFCKMGMHSKHNASYWFGTPYLGLGPSAHSYDGSSRQWNVSNLEKYCQRVLEPVEGPAYEKEQLSPEQHYDEYIMLRLRTHWGIDLKYMKREMGERFSSYCEKHAQTLIAQGRLSQTREFLYLNDAQMLFADGVAEELFWES